ncbi:hypothetical protein AB0M79_34685 [Polymorphospora sp. NPDC051019]|uniref:hypothetical protein n=1 Tax=Polymorphospora sp. NPDC051019 TaxID=3155725 RepID=UPI0034152474
MPSMPATTADSAPDPTGEEIILGIDTHKDAHVAAVITALGVQVTSASFPATAAGYRRLDGAPRRRCPHPRTRGRPLPT